MTDLLKGAPVAKKITEDATAEVKRLAERNVFPSLAIVRTGEREDDLSYERGAEKRCSEAGIRVRKVILDAGVDQDTYLRTVRELNADPEIHGILLLMPLPAQIDEEAVRRTLCADKDVDGCTDGSLAGVFANREQGFPPCTAQAVMEILDYYGISCSGKRATVAGRSLVVGRPAAMLLMHRNATVTVCHSKTEDLERTIQSADIAVISIGKMRSIGAECFREGQTVIDVGIHFNEETQRLCGDVRLEEAENLVRAVTPVPGGVGSVTTAVLAKHVVEAARRQQGRDEGVSD